MKKNNIKYIYINYEDLNKIDCHSIG